MRCATATRRNPRRRRAPSAPCSTNRNDLDERKGCREIGSPVFLLRGRPAVNRETLRRRLALAMMLGAALITWKPSTAAETFPPQKLQVAGLEVAAWLPSSKTPGPWPVIIFSHGFHGCSTQSTFLMKALAESGYAVFAPNHKDAACRNIRAWFSRPEARFGEPPTWSDATYADRDRDIESLIDALSKDPRFSGVLFDWNHL